MKNTYTFDIKNTYKRQIARNYIYYGNDNVFAFIHYSGGITVGPYITNYGRHTTGSDGAYRIRPKNSYIDETGCLFI